MIGGEVVARALKRNGIGTVFGLIGNQISPILTNLEKYGIDYIGTRHEQAAIHMADGWAQCRRSCGVAMVSGGPGFTNSINGIAKAYYAHTPLLVISGNIVFTQHDKGVLQDIDQISIVKGICKWAVTVFDVNRIDEYIDKAVKLAMSGRKGPVFLEFPINVLRAAANELCWSYNGVCENKAFTGLNCNIDMEIFKDFLKKYKKPVMLLGDEVYYSGADEIVVSAVNKLKIPVLTVNKARGLVPDYNAYCKGNGRIIDNGPQLEIIRKADLLLVVGVYCDYQMDCFGSDIFSGIEKILFLTESAHISTANERLDIISTDIGAFFDALDSSLDGQEKADELWLSEVDECVDSFRKKLVNEYSEANNGVSPYKLLSAVAGQADKDTLFVLDGSNAMFWANIVLSANEPTQIIIASDGQHGSMGCGLPLALGAKAAFPEKNVVLYTGDGSLGFNITETDTSVRYGLPVTIMVHNDRKWGLCETTQKILYNNVCGTVISNIDYASVIKGFGGKGISVRSDDDIKDININNDDNIIKCYDIFADDNAFSPGLKSFNDTLKKMR